MRYSETSTPSWVSPDAVSLKVVYVGFAGLAEGMEQVTQEIQKHDPTFSDKHNMLDHDRKFTDEMYALMYGIPEYLELFEAIYPYLGGLYSRLWGKVTKDTFNQVAAENEYKSGDDQRDFNDLMGFLFKNKRRQLMSKETILRNFDDLMVKRQTRGPGGKTKGRWDYLNPTNQQEIEALAKKFIDDDTFDWSIAIQRFAGDEVDPSLCRQWQPDFFEHV